MNYEHLSIIERNCIADYRNNGFSIATIARLIGRDKSTISRELSRNSTKRRGYNPAYAEQRYCERKRCCGVRPKIIKGNELYMRITSKLKQDWSPEQIVNTVMRGEVSVSTIYRSFHNKTLTPYVKHFRILTYQSGWRKNKLRGNSYKDAKTIHERPKKVKKREEFGHWELDTLSFCRKEKKAAAVFLERKSRNTMLVLLADKKAKTMKEAIKFSFINLPAKARKTLTVDRGREFLLWKEIEKSLPGTEIYFCDPMRPDQKGAVENMNGLLRQYYPKRKQTLAPSTSELAITQASLSNRPRKTLNYKTPDQVFNKELKKCCT